MNAIQSFEPTTHTAKTALSYREFQRRKKQKRNCDLERALELTLQIIINGCLSFVAFTALSKLLPYHLSQQQKLAEIRLEVEETETRVQKLRENFTGNFDPSQTKKVMEKNSYRVDPHQRPIFFLEDEHQVTDSRLKSN
jgi:hypothetical protein